MQLQLIDNKMYESSCSYQTALDLKRASPITQVGSLKTNLIMIRWRRKMLNLNLRLSHKTSHKNIVFKTKSLSA